MESTYAHPLRKLCFHGPSKRPAHPPPTSISQIKKIRGPKKADLPQELENEIRLSGEGIKQKRIKLGPHGGLFEVPPSGIKKFADQIRSIYLENLISKNFPLEKI